MKGMLGILNRGIHKVSLKAHVMRANLWRDSYNPLRGLTITRAVSELEEGERGAYGSVQWLYRYMEMQDATLGALIERRTSAVQEMGWDVKIPEGLEGAELELAEKQAEVLKEAYRGVKNLKAVIEHLCLASFRGYSHVEILNHKDGSIELEPVEQWYWVREGLNGEWQYNAKASFGSNKGESVGLHSGDASSAGADDRRWIVRECSRPINRVALIAFIRKSMSQKDWDGFIETYGIPAVFIIAPPEVPKGEEDEYQEIAERIASDARGVLPGGSDVKTVDNGARGVNPFLEHIKYQDELVILRGTGGKLTMLAESGSGTLAGGAHADSFGQIASAEAEEISEFLREGVDTEVLNAKFAGQKHYAYFEIAAHEETDVSVVIEDISELAAAGYVLADDEVSERTGYKVGRLEENESLKDKGESEDALKRLMNRKSLESSSTVTATELMRVARRRDAKPVADALLDALNGDDEDFFDRLRELNDELPDVGSPAAESALDLIMMNAYLSGVSGDQGSVIGEEVIRNAGNSKGAKKGWETRRRNGWTPKRTKQELGDYFDRVMSGEQKEFLAYSDVSAEEATNILALTGVDVAGYSHSIDSSAIRHILKQHGNPKKEAARGQIAIEKKDFEQLATYIRDANDLEASKTDKGLDAVRYYRDLEDGTTVVVEEIRTGRKKMTPVTMYKHSKKNWREKK